MFSVGDFVTGKTDNGYVYTTEKAYMLVTSVDTETYRFEALILAQKDIEDWEETIGTRFSSLSFNDFIIAPSFEEWRGKDCYICKTISNIEDYLNKEVSTMQTELKMVKNEYNIPKEQLDYYKSEIMELLPKYRFQDDKHYAPTNEGVDKLLEVYNKNKGWMYPYFMSHPNYIGNGKIAFSADYHRKINKKGVEDFINWVMIKVRESFAKKYSNRVCCMDYAEANMAIRELETIYETVRDLETFRIGQAACSVRVNNMTRMDIASEINRMNDIINRIQEGRAIRVNGRHVYISKKKANELDCIETFLNFIKLNPHMLVTEDEVDGLNELTKFLDLRIVSGQKMSRVIGKFCKKLGIDKEDEYQQYFARLGDDINELDIRRHTIISINPIDYYTMSFGNSWSSCHTIDKMNDRNSSGQHYHGQYSGGTESYMLDGASIVYYTVNKKYDGTDFEFQPKVNRCMFHIGEDKLIQGRVYPQNNDGDDTIYTEIRAIMQKVVSEMFNFNNLWIYKKGTRECECVTVTDGVHYPDYRHYNVCSVSYIKPEDGNSKNTKMISIGRNPICPKCGEEHHNSSYIVCSDCIREVKRCPHCGRVIRDDDHIEIDGQTYCSNCARWCDHHQRFEIDTPMTRVYRNQYRRESILVCDDALRDNSTRYRRDFYNTYYYDTSVYTGGIVTGEGYYLFTLNRAVRNPERGYHSAERDWRVVYDGTYYLNDNTIYDRRSRQWIPVSEWNTELNCWNGIAEQVREHNEMLEARARRREARQARRAMESVA